ncbi:MAG: GNAT family N-acetyltransferase [Nitrospirae bacterium]|nr:GNAT family N-acetyltransferase [Nitrospirota bacterium]
MLNRIAGSTEQADPFCCRTEWQFSFHEAFSPHRELYFRNSDTSIIAFAGYEHPNIGTILEPIESNWCFCCPVLGPDAVDLLSELLQEGPFCHARPFVLLSGLIPGSSLFIKVLTTFQEHYQFFRQKPTVTRCASLSGNVDGYLSRRSSKFRRNIRQAAIQLAGIDVVFERCLPRSEEQADEAYGRMLAVEETSWKGIEQCGMNVQPSRDFYGLMLRRLSLSGKGRVIFARRDGCDIGYIFGGITGGYYRGQQFSFAEDWSSYSIGNVLQMEKIRWMCEEGMSRYDMGQAMDYKVRWAELELQTENLLLRPIKRES